MILDDIWDLIGGVFEDISDYINSLVTSAKRKINLIKADVGKLIKDFSQDIIRELYNAVHGVKEKFEDVTLGLYTKLRSKVGEIASMVHEGIIRVKSAINNISTTVMREISSVQSIISNKFNIFSNVIVRAIGDFRKNIQDTITNKFHEIMKGFTDVKNFVHGQVKNFTNAVSSGIEGVKQTLTNVGNEILNGISSTVNSLLTGVLAFGVMLISTLNRLFMIEPKDFVQYCYELNKAFIEFKLLGGE